MSYEGILEPKIKREEKNNTLAKNRARVGTIELEQQRLEQPMWNYKGGTTEVELQRLNNHRAQ
jgi:hypothetical protein